MKTPKLTCALFCLLLAIGFGSHARAQVTHLTLQSQPGDFIGGGQNYDITYTPANSTSFFYRVVRTLPTGEPAELDFVLGGNPTLPFSTVTFGTDQLGIPMQPGFYADAQRADFAAPGHPGLDVTFDSWGSNTLTGNFTVTDFAYSPALGIESFAASFEQHSDGATPALSGTFTFQAVPEPSTVSLLALCSVGVVGLRLRRNFTRTCKSAAGRLTPGRSPPACRGRRGPGPGRPRQSSKPPARPARPGSP